MYLCIFKLVDASELCDRIKKSVALLLHVQFIMLNNIVLDKLVHNHQVMLPGVLFFYNQMGFIE